MDKLVRKLAELNRQREAIKTEIGQRMERCEWFVRSNVDRFVRSVRQRADEWRGDDDFQRVAEIVCGDSVVCVTAHINRDDTRSVIVLFRDESALRFECDEFGITQPVESMGEGLARNIASVECVDLLFDRAVLAVRTLPEFLDSVQPEELVASGPVIEAEVVSGSTS